MKKMIVVLVFAMSLIGGKVLAAGEEDVSRQAKETFKREFPLAEIPKWEAIENGDLYMVRFVYDNQGFVAYINNQGTLIASARLVKKENLPYKVSQTIRKAYSDKDILKIEELTMDGTLSYFFTIENNSKSVVLRVYHDGAVQRISEAKKKFSKNGKE